MYFNLSSLLSCVLYIVLFVGVQLETGAEVVCSILDIDLVECCLVLTRNPNLLTQSSSAAGISTRTRSRRSKSSLSVEGVGFSSGSSVVGLVELKTPNFLVLSCSTLSGCKLAYGLINSVSQEL